MALEEFELLRGRSETGKIVALTHLVGGFPGSAGRKCRAIRAGRANRVVVGRYGHPIRRR